MPRNNENLTMPHIFEKGILPKAIISCRKGETGDFCLPSRRVEELLCSVKRNAVDGLVCGGNCGHCRFFDETRDWVVEQVSRYHGIKVEEVSRNFPGAALDGSAGGAGFNIFLENKGRLTIIEEPSQGFWIVNWNAHDFGIPEKEAMKAGRPELQVDVGPGKREEKRKQREAARLNNNDNIFRRIDRYMKNYSPKPLNEKGK